MGQISTMILLFTGANSFAQREAYDAIRAAHDQDGALAANTVVFAGGALTSAELQAAATTVPFLAGHRLVRVDGLCGRFEVVRGGRRRSLGEWEALPDVLQAVPASTLLIFVDGAVAKANPVRALIEEGGEVRDFPPLKEGQLVPWVRTRARALGAQLTPGAERRLVEQVGNDLWALASEIEKLRLYAGSATVDETVVGALAPVNREATIWQLVDAVADGRTAGAMQALDTLRSGGETAQYILRMIARQMRLITVAREALDGGGSVAEVQDRLEVSPFVARRALAQADRYTQAAADAALRRVLACEVAIQDYRHDRPGGLRDDLALELLVADLTGAGRRAAPAVRQREAAPPLS